MQFCMYYCNNKQAGDDISSQESLNNTPDDNIIVASVSTNEEFLPASIILQNGSTLLRNRKPKLITYKTPNRLTEEYRELMVCLFFPHQSLEELDDEGKIDHLFNLKTSHDQTKTNIEKIRSLLFPFFNHELCDSVFI